MSLESYKKALDAQRMREERKDSHEYGNFPENIDYEKGSYRRNRKRRHIRPLLIIVIIILILLLAAIKNPSPTEAKAEVKTLVMDKWTEYVHDKMAEEKSKGDFVEVFGSSIAILLGSVYYDNSFITDIDNYIFFSTFNVRPASNPDEMTFASGVIIFGSPVVLYSGGSVPAVFDEK